MCSCQQGCGGPTRREFVQGSVAAAVGALLAGACGDGQIGGVGPGGLGAPAQPFTIRLADYPQLATVGGMAILTVPAPVAVVRTGAGGYDVFSLSCPHAGTTILPTPTGFHCPNHGATWNASGTWIGGQQTSGLRRLQATYDAAVGTLLIEGSGNVDLTIRVADFPALATVGGIARVDGNSRIPIGVARLGPATFAGYGLACPHEQNIIGPAGAGWRCPEHGARFAADGSLLEGPAQTGLTALSVTHDPIAGTLRIRGNAVAGKNDD